METDDISNNAITFEKLSPDVQRQIGGGGSGSGSGVKIVVIQKSEYEALPVKDKDTLYFVTADKPTQWVFGNALPIILV
ncbi:MAG: hypothetical protein K6D91_05990 [Prevotella sp.]|nr:hypothetical protein [Prevotella sp.]